MNRSAFGGKGPAAPQEAAGAPRTPGEGTAADQPAKGSAGSSRDQNESAFAAILAALLTRVPGSRGAALVDPEGETVDYAGRMNPFDVRVTAAHLRIVIDEVALLRSAGSVQRLVIRASRRSFLVQVLPDGYALVVVFLRTAGFSGHSRALSVCARALGKEAGWSWSPEMAPPSWFPLDIVSDARRRPTAVRLGSAEHRLEILGALVSGDALRKRERGWRVRFDNGIEATLVREPGPPTRFGGPCWYSDEPVVDSVVAGSRARSVVVSKAIAREKAPLEASRNAGARKRV